MQFSAAHQWVESPQSSVSPGLTQVTSAASPAKHLTLSDDDDNITVQLQSETVGAAPSQSYSYLAAVLNVLSPLPFLARGPPVVLS